MTYLQISSFWGNSGRHAVDALTYRESKKPKQIHTGTCTTSLFKFILCLSPVVPYIENKLATYHRCTHQPGPVFVFLSEFP